MAKEKYEYPYSDERGNYTFRTIGGRKVKIYENQSLADAMIESGKFKGQKNKPGMRASYRKEKEKDLQEEEEKFNNLKNLGQKTERNEEEILKAQDELISKYRENKKRYPFQKQEEVDESKPSLREQYKQEGATDLENIKEWEQYKDANQKALEREIVPEFARKNKGAIEEAEREIEKSRNNLNKKADEVLGNKSTKDPYDDPESEESQRLQDIQSRYDEYLQKTEGRGASYGEIAYVDSLRGKDLDDFEKELDDFDEDKVEDLYQEQTEKKHTNVFNKNEDELNMALSNFGDFNENYFDIEPDEWNNANQEKRNEMTRNALQRYLEDNNLSREQIRDISDVMENENFHTASNLIEEVYDEVKGNKSTNEKQERDNLLKQIENETDLQAYNEVKNGDYSNEELDEILQDLKGWNAVERGEKDFREFMEERKNQSTNDYGGNKALYDLENSKYSSKEKLERAKEKVKNKNISNDERQYYQDYIEKREGKSIKDIISDNKSTNNIDPYEIYEKGMQVVETTDDYKLKDRINKTLDKIDRANKRGEGYSQKATNELKNILSEIGVYDDNESQSTNNKDSYEYRIKNDKDFNKFVSENYGIIDAHHEMNGGKIDESKGHFGARDNKEWQKSAIETYNQIKELKDRKNQSTNETMNNAIRQKASKKSNTIPRDYEKITYTSKIDTNAGKKGDKFELYKNEYGDTITKNLRTGETFTANMSMLRTPEAVEINDVVKKQANKANETMNDTIREKANNKASNKNNEYKRMINDFYALSFGDSSQNYEDVKGVPFSKREKAVKSSLYIDDSDILNRFGEDYGYDKGDKLKNLKGQIDYMRNPNESINQTAKRFASGGDFLIYDGDMRDYLKLKGIKYNDDNYFEKYTQDMANRVEKLYNQTSSENMNNNIRKQANIKNAYKQYLKDHPNSNMTLNQFKKMNK